MPTIIATTPHRVSLAGGATDIPEFYKSHGYGATVGIAIEPLSNVTIMPRSWDDRGVMFRYSKTVEAANTEELDQADPAQFRLKVAGRHVGVQSGFELTSQSGTSYKKGGSGLGSSSSFAASLLLSLYVFGGERKPTGTLDARQLSELRYWLAEKTYYFERELLGQHVGKQDQYTAVFGGINHFRFNSDDGVEVTRIPLSIGNRIALSGQLHLFYTGVHRDAETLLRGLAGSAADNAQALLRMRSLADETRDRLMRGDIDSIGEMLDRGWQLKKTLDPNISNERIDRA